jgi:histidinol-phosphate aminotransferase
VFAVDRHSRERVPALTESVMLNRRQSDPAFLPALRNVTWPRGDDPVSRHAIANFTRFASIENPLGASPRARAAIVEAQANLHSHPSVTAADLRQGLARWFGHGLTSEQFVTGNGAGDVLTMVARAFLEPGDEAILCPPTFMLYEMLTRAAEATPVFVPLEAPAYHYNLDAVLAAVTPRTRLIWLCTPNNPTGGIIPAAGLDAFLAQLPSGIIVVLDEAYQEYVTDADRSGSLEHVREGRPLLVVRSFSKIYGLAGLRVGYGCAPVGLAGRIRRLSPPFHPSSVKLAGALAALDDLDHVAYSRALVDTERPFLYRGLAKLGLSFVTSAANFVCFDPQTDPQALCDELLKEGVSVRPLSAFRMPTHIRVTVGTYSENARFLDALGHALRRLKA